MNLFFHDPETFALVVGIFVLLLAASSIGLVLKKTVKSEKGQETILNLNARINAWWIMIIIFFLAVATGEIGTVILFGLTSFLALREYITLTPTHRADHRALFWAFFIITPLQYVLIAFHRYGLAIIMIPVYAYLFVPIRNVIAGNCQDFLARSAKIQWGLMVCVYFVSYAPALLLLRIPGWEGQDGKLLYFLVCVAQMSDVLQYVFGKCFGRHRIAPSISPNKTIEGFVGGVTGAVLIGTGLYWITPFHPWQAALMALTIALMGFYGGLVMSAIKRDRGVKDYGTIIPGHGGIMDRIDSLCFAAPVFFHLTRFFFG
ncbi:MAG: phosphatidate cytidylyltransferase [Candidatus Methylacidiphilaceae bacterium]